MNNKKLNNGFTVLELIIVLIIVGILASLATYSYRQYIAKSYQSIAITMLQIYKINMIKYSLDRNINIKDDTFFENFYDDFSKNQLNPNNNSNYSSYYNITYDNGFLIASPTKNNKTKLYARMKLDTTIIEKCKMANNPKKITENDICEDISNFNKL